MKNPDAEIISVMQVKALNNNIVQVDVSYKRIIYKDGQPEEMIFSASGFDSDILKAYQKAMLEIYISLGIIEEFDGIELVQPNTSVL
jgi:hypothetical protein